MVVVPRVPICFTRPCIMTLMALLQGKSREGYSMKRKGNLELSSNSKFSRGLYNCKFVVHSCHSSSLGRSLPRELLQENRKHTIRHFRLRKTNRKLRTSTSTAQSSLSEVTSGMYIPLLFRQFHDQISTNKT